MGTWKMGTVAMVAILLLLVACTPKVAPAPTPPQSTPSASPVPQAAPPASRPSQQEESWARVVDAAQKEGKVIVYSFGFIGELGNALSNAFFKKYGIRADIITGPGGGLSERIRTEQRMKNVVADVGELSPAFGVLLLQEGQLVPLANELPVFREDVWLVPLTIDDKWHILRHNLSYGSPWINTDLVKPEDAPKSWTDLADPRWKGKLLSIDPSTTTTPDRFVHSLTRFKLVEPDFFPRLAAQKLIVPTGVGPRPPYVALARGEGAVLIFGLDSQGAVVIGEGAHIRPTAPKEGLTVASSGIELIKNASHPNAGKLFIDFVLSREGHELETRINLVGSLRKDVPDRSVSATLKPFKMHPSTIEDEDQMNKNFREGVAAKALGLR